MVSSAMALCGFDLAGPEASFSGVSAWKPPKLVLGQGLPSALAPLIRAVWRDHTRHL